MWPLRPINLSIRSWRKPFIPDMTTISAATPSTIPRNEKPAMTEIDRWALRARRYRNATIHSKAENALVAGAVSGAGASSAIAVTVWPCNDVSRPRILAGSRHGWAWAGPPRCGERMPSVAKGGNETVESQVAQFVHRRPGHPRG